MTKTADVIVVGGGHNGLVAAGLMAKAGRRVLVLEDKHVVGGAVRTERPFKKAPNLGTSTGAYLLGLMPPEIPAELGIELPVMRRDPHYFLPTTRGGYLLFGSDADSTREQFIKFFSEQDWHAHCALQAEISALREDIAPTWLAEPLSIEETASRYVRPALQQHFVNLCRGTIGDYLGRFGFKSELVMAMYAVTDAFSGLNGGWDTPGTGMNFLVHNMCRLPGADGTWMIVRGGMGTVSGALADKARAYGATIRTDARVTRIEVTNGRATGVELASGELLTADTILVNADPFKTHALVGAERFDDAFNARMTAWKRTGTTLKVNMALSGLPKFTCLPEDRGQYGTTIHLLPEGDDIIGQLRRSFADVQAGRLSERPTIEWYIHTTVDPSLQDASGLHNSALFVQWVPHTLEGTTWEAELDGYVKRLLAICDEFAPGSSDLVVDTFPLTPQGIEAHFGITHGHIHHIDNAFGFADRFPTRLPIDGLFSCSAGCHPAGSVIGAAGYIAAKAALGDA